MSDLANPLGAGFFNFIETGAQLQTYEIDPDVSGDLPLGTVMEIEDYSGPGLLNPPLAPLIQPSSTSQDDNVIGVLVGGLDYASNTIAKVPPRGVAQVLTSGICQVLCDASTTAGQPMVASPITPGCAESTATPTKRTIGLCLQSVEISSGTALVWAYIGPGTQGGSGGGGGTPIVIQTPLSYAGVGPVEAWIIVDPTSYDPSGVYTCEVVNNDLVISQPATAYVDDGVIQYVIYWNPSPSGQVVVEDPNGNALMFNPGTLALPLNAGEPGNTVAGAPAIVGSIVQDTTTNTLWICIQSYEPTVPQDAIWVNVVSGGVPTLELSWNGNGPVECQVLDGLAWNPSVGGYLFVVVPNALSGFGYDFPAFAYVDDTGTIQSLVCQLYTNNFYAFGPTASQITLTISELEIGTNIGNPGNTPGGIDAQAGQLYVDPVSDGLWVCVTSYSPPTDAVWVFLQAGPLEITVNDGPVVSTGLLPLSIPKLPIVPPETAILPPQPYIFGREFNGEIWNPYFLPAPNAAAQGICTGPDNNLWVTDNNSATPAPGVWQLNPLTSATQFFALPSDSNPTGICTGPDGNLWLSDMARHSVWQCTTEGVLTEFTLSGSAAPYEICAGPDGNLWANDAVLPGGWQITTAGVATSFTFGTGPLGVCAGPDGNLWFADGVQVDQVSPTLGLLNEFALPGASAVGSCCTGPDSNIWLCDNDAANVYKVTPAGVVTQFAMPNDPEDIAPTFFAVVAGGGGDLWLTQSNNPFLWRVTTAGVPTPFAIPPDLSFIGIWMCVAPDGSFAMTSINIGEGGYAQVLTAPFTLLVGDLDITQGAGFLNDLQFVDSSVTTEEIAPRNTLVIVDTTATTVTIDLDSYSAGTHIAVMKSDASPNSVAIETNGGAGLFYGSLGWGVSAYALLTQGQGQTFIADGQGNAYYV